MKTIEEKNAMIAEFIGMQKTELGWYDNDEVLKLPNTSDNTFDDLLFNTSWDWLMPVVEKIEKTNNNLCEVIIHKTQTEIITGERTGVLRFSYSLSELILLGYKVNEKIDITYHCVCEFINWYNENKKQ
jgi:hypothetical protein